MPYYKKLWFVSAVFKRNVLILFIYVGHSKMASPWIYISTKLHNTLHKKIKSTSLCRKCLFWWNQTQFNALRGWLYLTKFKEYSEIRGMQKMDLFRMVSVIKAWIIWIGWGICKHNRSTSDHDPNHHGYLCTAVCEKTGKLWGN